MQNKHKTILFLFFALLFLYTASQAAYADTVSNENAYKDRQILVEFKRNPKEIFDSFLNNFANSHNLIYQSTTATVANSKHGYFLFESTTETPVQELINALKKDARVKKAQPNYIFQSAKLTSLKKSNKPKSSQDRYFKKEWWVYNNGSLGTAGSDVYVMSVWNQEQKSWPQIALGIIDSGVNPKHTDLKKNIVSGYDFVHDRKSKMQDKDGHGSFIAGLIASQVNNKKGIAGLSRQNLLKIMPLKFDFSTDEAILAIAYAQAKGVRILNASWGTEEYDEALYESIKNFNGLVITAAGNEGQEHNLKNHFYPCDFDLDNVICVGASSENDQITSYSDWGDSVDILAPGGENAPLISLDSKTNKYTQEIGTSFSAALVSGGAGLVLSANPYMTNSEIKSSILDNARKIDSLSGKVIAGGVLNIRGAVNKENDQ